MTKYRVVKRASRHFPGDYVWDVEKQVSLFFGCIRYWRKADYWYNEKKAVKQAARLHFLHNEPACVVW